MAASSRRHHKGASFHAMAATIVFRADKITLPPSATRLAHGSSPRPTSSSVSIDRSWRSGGVQTARQAGISDPVIMAMGRWSTIAWERYSVASLKDLQGAAERMWAEAEKRANSGCRVVGSVDTAGIFAEDHALGTSISQAAQANTGVTIRFDVCIDV